jgi:hypothetical protein
MVPSVLYLKTLTLLPGDPWQPAMEAKSFRQEINRCDSNLSETGNVVIQVTTGRGHVERTVSDKVLAILKI